MYEAYNYLLHGQPWQWRNIGRGALLGAIGGAVASPLIAWLAPVLPVGLSGGIIGGTVASVPANLAQQGFSCMMGWQHSIDPFQIGWANGRTMWRCCIATRSVCKGTGSCYTLVTGWEGSTRPWQMGNGWWPFLAKLLAQRSKAERLQVQVTRDR
jgi:hypothetical protein